MREQRLRLLCPAKINLHLRVGRRRQDGFHPLLTWMATLGGLFDTLTVEARPWPAGGDDLSTRTARQEDQPPSGRERAGAERILLLSSDLPGLPVDESNLIVRAAEAFAVAIAGSGTGEVHKGTAAEPSGSQKRADAKSGSVSPTHPALVAAVPSAIGVGRGVGDAPGTAAQPPTRGGGEAARVGPVYAVLEKTIPLGAGLGGGSSDAARTLLGLNRLWQINWPTDRLAPIAATLGSDVPFFLYGPSSICTGRGEIVRPVSRPRKARWAAVILPQIHMPTAAVYRRFDELGLGYDDEIREEPDWEQLAGLGAKELLPRLVNDLEMPSFEIRQDLGTLRADIERSLGRPVRMSGSGSSLFTLFDDPQEAESAAGNISARFKVRGLKVDVAPEVHDDLNAARRSA